MFGRLGTGSEADQLSPVEVNFGNSQINLVGIAAGAYHSLALQGLAFTFLSTELILRSQFNQRVHVESRCFD